MSSFFEYHNVRIEWLHHASFLLQAGGTNLYIDPFKVTGEPQADYVLISHDHFDHFDEESLKALSQESTKVIASGAVKKTNVVDVMLEPGVPAKLGDWLITCVTAYNIGKAFHQKDSGNCGFLIENSRVVVYHAGDTDWIPEMSALHGKVHVALLPIGGTYTMDADDAVKAVATIKPEVAIPMHYNYLDETKVTKEMLERFVNEAGKHCKHVVVLEPKI